MRRIISMLLALSLLAVIFSGLSLSAESDGGEEYIVYENNFDNGASSVPGATDEGYAAQNEFMDFDGILGQPLQNSEMNGDMGVRIRRGAWLDGQTFLFDFTKGGTKKGIYSGIWTAAFDFSLDKDGGANEVIMGMNMSKTYEGERMAYFHNNGAVEVLSDCGAWGSKANPECLALNYGKVYNLKTVVNFDEGKADYYLDGKLIRTQTNLKNKTMNNFSVSLSGTVGYFDNLKITVRYPNPTENIVTSDNIGNIFYEDEPVLLKLTTINRHSGPICEDISIVITDPDNNTVWSASRQVTVSGKSEKESEINPGLSLFGTYFMKVKSDNSREFTTRLSRSVRAGVQNKKFGVCAHFDGRYNLDIPGVFDIMSAMGAGNVRTDWGCRIKSNGTVYDYDSDNSYFEKTIYEAQKHGIDILAILGTTVAGGGSSGGFNVEETALSSYRKYCRELAQKLRGKVEQFELGNEDNYVKRRAAQSDVGVNRIVFSNSRTLADSKYLYVYSGENYTNPAKYPLSSINCSIEEKKDAKGEIYSSLSAEQKESGGEIITDVPAYVFETGENYYKIMKAGYAGIKEGNPNAVAATSGSGVVYTDPDGTLNRNQREFAKGILVAAQSNGDYCFDVYATHPYHTAQAPEIADRWIANTKWADQGIILNGLFNEFGVPQEKQRWATELGYSADDSNGARLKAAWIVRTLLANDIYDLYDKMYIYDILDDGLNISDPEHHYGTVCCYKDEAWYNVSSYAAKPQYLALAQYNKMISGGELVRNTLSSDTIYTSQFKNNENNVYVIWNTSGKNQKLSLPIQANMVRVYDMYGNVIDMAENIDSIDVTAGEEPVYVECFNQKTEIKLSDNTGEVTVVNDTDKPISPVTIVSVYDENGKPIYIEIRTDYTVNGETVSEIAAGQVAKQIVNTDYEGYSTKVMLWRDLETMMPMCEAKSK